MSTTRWVRKLCRARQPFLLILRHSSTLSDPFLGTPSRTPLENQFEAWTHRLKPGQFTSSDVDVAIRSQVDPDLALDIFRWTAQQRYYKHDHVTYLTMIETLISGRRYKQVETLMDEVLAGACDAFPELYNAIIRFCFSRGVHYNRAFDIYKKMLGSKDCKPNLRTYTLLFSALLRRFGNKLHVSFVYLHSVKSLNRQMNTLGVIPDLYVLNMLIKAYSKCLEVDEALRVFREMGLYGYQPNAYSYSYLIGGLCEKCRVGLGLVLYKEMKGKGIVPPSSGCYMILISSLAMAKRSVDALAILDDMLLNSMSPDLLTYRTLVDELCRDGKSEMALVLLEDWKKRDVAMKERTYRVLLDSLHFANNS